MEVAIVLALIAVMLAFTAWADGQAPMVDHVLDGRFVARPAVGAFVALGSSVGHLKPGTGPAECVLIVTAGKVVTRPEPALLELALFVWVARTRSAYVRRFTRSSG